MATRKIHFFTGKGGVGKSTLAAAYALRLSEEKGSNILLTELSERSFYKHFLSGPSHSTLSSSLPFAVSQWSPDSCLREYALHLLKIESLYKLFFQNPVSKSLIQVAPGLPELAILGKATSGPRRHGPSMPYDEIVIDSMSSGHFLALLRAPRAMSEIISFGPMGEQSRSIDKWIRNSEFTNIHVVTTAEDYAVTETIELCDQIFNELGIQPQIYLNKILNFSLSFTKELKAPIFSDLIQTQNQARSKILKSRYSLKEVFFYPELQPLNLVKLASRSMINA